MIPTLQFDTSSLTFWYDTHLISRARGSQAIGQALDLALRGFDDQLARHVGDIEDNWVRVRAASVSSAVWHEKRHFLDYILTNYGAFRMRQFFMVYVNLNALLAEAKGIGHLVAPVQSWLNPGIRSDLGLSEPTPPINEIIRDILSRKKILTEDRKPVTSRMGTMAIGGEAQLEAIAHLVQHGKTHRVFGRDISEAVQRDVPAKDLNARVYTWAYSVLITAGLIDPPEVLHQTDDGFTSVLLQDAPVIPICYAALACRLYRQPQTRTDSAFSYMPADRLASLGVELRGQARQFRGLNATDCWDFLQKTCKNLFGRTVIEEIEADYEHEEQLLVRLRTERTFPTVLQAYEDFHELRGRLFSILKQQPELIVDQGAWADHMVSRLQPITIVAATSGEIGRPPPSYDQVLGYNDPHVSDDVKEKQWWWAASPQFWPERDNPAAINLQARHHWLEIVSILAPIAKLLVDGRTGRKMLGPEILRAEAYLNTEIGLQVRIDPRFAYPPSARISTEYWRWMTGHDAFRCDLSYETVRSPEGMVLSPWALRLKRGMVEALLGDLRQNYRRHLHFWRDWSPYLLNEEFRQIAESFEDDPSPFISQVIPP